MSGTELWLAATLLSAPAGAPLPDITAEEWPALQAAIHTLAMEWEILDPRELKYVLAKREDAEGDLNLLRRRNQELNDAPRLNDSARFPDRAAVNDMLTFNRAFRRHLDGRQVLEADRAACYREALQETDRLYYVWDAVRDARCEFYYVTVRRAALKKLRGLVGPEAYYAGNLPPYVPLWRFPEMH
jgi:hypothetical protein